MGVHEVQRALDTALPEKPSEAVWQRLVRLWPQIEELVVQALEARMKDRTESMRSPLYESEHREKMDVQYVLRKLEKELTAIKTLIANPTPNTFPESKIHGQKTHVCNGR